MLIPRLPRSRSETVNERQERSGFVLFLAILAVVVVGALIVATHAAVRLEQAVTAATIDRQRAFAAAEHALWSSVASWNPANSALPPRAASTEVIRAAGDSAIITTVRVNGAVYWLVAEAQVGDQTRRVRRRTGINVRVVTDSAGTRYEPVRRSWLEIH